MPHPPGCPHPLLPLHSGVHSSSRGPGLISAIALYLDLPPRSLLACRNRLQPPEVLWMQLCVCKTTCITLSLPSPFPGFLLYSGASSAPKLTSQGYFEPLLLSYSSSNSGHVMPCPLTKCLWCLLSPLNFLPALAQSPIIPNLHPILPPSTSKQKFAISSLCKAIWYPLACKIKSKLLSAMHKAL